MSFPLAAGQADQSDHALAGSNAGLKREHSLHPLQVLDGSLLPRCELAGLVSLEIAEADLRDPGFQQVDDARYAPTGVEFPVEGEVVAPPSIFVDHAAEATGIATGESSFEGCKPFMSDNFRRSDFFY